MIFPFISYKQYNTFKNGVDLCQKLYNIKVLGSCRESEHKTKACNTSFFIEKLRLKKYYTLKGLQESKQIKILIKQKLCRIKAY